MKRTGWGILSAICVGLLLCGIAAAQSASPSLGDFARTQRKKRSHDDKPAAKVYDNDNLPAENSINVVGPAQQAAADNTSDADANDANGNNKDKPAPTTAAPTAEPKKPAGEIKPGQSPDDRQKAYKVWQDRISDQKKKVDQLSRDLDDYQHKAMPQVPVWPDSQVYAQGVAERQKAVEQAKAELGDVRDQARKAGVPASLIE
jgi:FtsZ-interacting cell division protein ZipA